MLKILQHPRPIHLLLRLGAWVTWIGVGATALAVPPASAERGPPPLERFQAEALGEQRECFALVQDLHGVLYTGGRDRVLAYDGHRWQSLTVPGTLAIHALAVDSRNRLWVGGTGEVGYLEDDGRGGRTYTSLLAQLPASERTFREINHLYAQGDTIVFAASDRLLVWHAGRFTIERTGPLHTWPARDGRIVRHRTGVAQLEIGDGTHWRVLLAHPNLRENEARFVTDLADGRWLVAFEREGLWLWDGARLEYAFSDALQVVRARRVVDGLRLRDGTLALSLRQGGIVLLDEKLSLLRCFGLDDQLLPSPLINSLCEDHQGALWVSSLSGLIRLTLGPITVFGDARHGQHRATHVIARHAGVLHIGTSEGLFQLEPLDAQGTAPRAARWRELPGSSSVGALAATNDELFIAASDGFGVRSAIHEHLVADESIGRVHAILTPSQDPRALYLATPSALLALHREANRWVSTGLVAGLNIGVRQFVETPAGEVWCATGDQGVMRITGLPGTASARGQPLQCEDFSHALGLLASSGTSREPVTLALAGNETVFLVAGRLHSFDSATKKLLPLAALNTRLDRAAASHVAVYHSATPNQIWLAYSTPASVASELQLRRHLARVSFNGHFEELPSSAVEAAGDVLTVLEESEGSNPGRSVVWLGGNAAVVRSELPQAFAPPVAFRAALRRITGQNGDPLPLAGTLRLPFAARALRLDFASDRLDGRQLDYAVQLDDEPALFKPDSTRTLERLPAGAHTVVIRARDADGRLSAPAQLSFVILPPWWRTWWSLALAVLAATAAVAGLVRWRVRAVQRRNAELEKIVATRTAELREAKTAAEASNRAKSSFLANMSHELRTPLNAILGFAQILRRAPDVAEEHRARLAIIGRNGDHLLALINEILDLSKIEAGKLALAPRPFRLPGLLESIAETFSARATDQGLVFKSEFAPDLPAYVFGDDAKLRQVLFNLLGNALKFTERGSVTFSVSAAHPLNSQRSTLSFSITDTGVGIAHTDTDRIFEPFHQTGANRLASQGSGLGLTISQRIVELMEGRIAVVSTPGQGSRFHFKIPLLAVAAPAPEAPPRTITGYAGPRQHLLVIDDEPANRHVLRDLLEPLGFTIDECADGPAGLAAFARQMPRAVLLDLRMPGGLDGFETARRLRQLSGGESASLIAVSASVFEEDRQLAIDAGCDDFLPKPFNADRLFQVLREHLDLAWTFAPTEPLRASSITDAPPAATDAPLPAHEADALRDLARRGDIKAFRERLKVVAGRHPECARVVVHLDGLAANFQLGRLRQELPAAPPQPPA